MEKQLYDFLQSLLPSTITFANPYIDDCPPPKGDWCNMNIINTRNVGRSAERQNFIDSDNRNVGVAYDLEKVYTIQFNFYGANAFENAEVYMHTLQVSLDNSTQAKTTKYNLKTFSVVRNLTELLENKKYYRRYNFDVEIYTIETISTIKPFLTNYQLEKVVISQ